MPTDSIPAGAHIGHVHLKVAEIARSVKFYHELMGFDVITQLGNQAAFLSAGGYHHHIGLNTWESAGGQPPAAGTTGLYHLPILYPEPAALADALQRLVAAGIPLEGASDHGGSEGRYFRAPPQNREERSWD